MQYDIVKHKGTYIALEIDDAGVRSVRDEAGRSRFESIEDVHAMLERRLVRDAASTTVEDDGMTELDALDDEDGLEALHAPARTADHPAGGGVTSRAHGSR